MAVDTLLHRPTTPTRLTWGDRDCAIYALAVGADFEDRAFLMTDCARAHQLVYPTYALSLVALEANGRSDPLLGVVRPEAGSTVLLGAQTLHIHRPIDPTGEADLSVVAVDLQDKESGALLASNAAVYCRAWAHRCLRRGWTCSYSARAASAARKGSSTRQPVPARAPDSTFRIETARTQSLLYMVGGNDHHAIHVDPSAAAMAGFGSPILSGQNTLGFACRMVTRHAANGDPARVRSISAKMRKPALSGEPLTVQLWGDNSQGESGRASVHFRVLDDAGDLVLDEGVCVLGGQSQP